MSTNENFRKNIERYGVTLEQVGAGCYTAQSGANIEVGSRRGADINPFVLSTESIEQLSKWLRLNRFDDEKVDIEKVLPLFSRSNESVESGKLRRQAYDYLLGEIQLNEQERKRVDADLGPFNMAIYAAGDITVGPGANVTINSGGALEIGTLTIKAGGSLIVKASTQITVAKCIKEGAASPDVFDIQIIGTDYNAEVPIKGDPGGGGSAGKGGANGDCNDCGTACTKGTDGTAGGTGGQGFPGSVAKNGGNCPAGVTFNIQNLVGDINVMSRGGNGNDGGAGGNGGKGGNGGSGGSGANCASCSCDGGKQGTGGSGGPGYKGNNGGDGGIGGVVQFEFTPDATGGNVFKYELFGAGGALGAGGSGGGAGTGGGASPGSNGSPGNDGKDGNRSTINVIRN